MWQVNHPQCVWKYLKLKTCRYINHNYGICQFDLGLDKCEYLVPAVVVTGSVFRPPPDTCAHWGSGLEHGRVLVELQEFGKVRHLALITRLYFACWKDSGSFWANNEGEQVGPVLETNQNIEFLNIDPTCALPWIAYTAGGLPLVGTISGALLPDGSSTCVSKVTCDNLWLSFGYHDTKPQLVYY